MTKKAIGKQDAVWQEQKNELWGSRRPSQRSAEQGLQQVESTTPDRGLSHDEVRLHPSDRRRNCRQRSRTKGRHRDRSSAKARMRFNARRPKKEGADTRYQASVRWKEETSKNQVIRIRTKQEAMGNASTPRRRTSKKA